MRQNREGESLTRLVVEGSLNPWHVIGREERFLPHAYIARGPIQQLLPVKLGPDREVDVPKVLLPGSLHLEEVPKSPRIKGPEAFLLVQDVQSNHKPITVWIDLNGSDLIVMTDLGQERMKG